MPHDFRKFQCLLLAACLTAGMAGRVEAGSVSFSTYYPAPFGVYDRLRLPPRPALAEPCDAGAFYYEQSVGLRFCDETTLTWGGLGGGVWTQSGNNIYPADTASNPNLMVGIGTTTPSAKLTIQSADPIVGTLGFGDSWGNIWSDGGTDGFFTIANNGAAAGRTSFVYGPGNELLTIQNSGNVGIGTTSPTDKLTVNGTFGTTGNAFIDGNLNIKAVPHNDSGVSLYAWSNTNAQAIFQGQGDVDNYAVISLMTDASVGNQAWQMRHGKRAEVLNKFNIAYRNAAGFWSYPMTIDTTGNVGIGTTDPQQRLHIYNNGDNILRIDTSNGAAYDPAKIAQIEFVRGPDWSKDWSWVGPTWDTAINAATWDIWTAENIPMLFAVNDDEKMRISTDGNVGIGTTDPGNYSINVEKTGDARLKLFADSDNNNESDNPLIYMTQDGGGNAFLIGMTGAAGTDPFESLYTGTTLDAMFIGDPGGGSGSGDLQFGTNNAVRMTIDGNIGNVGIGTTAPAEKLEVNGNVKAASFLYASDEHLKKDIMTLSGSLEKILNLRGVQFKWKNGGNGENIGFIAQEVEKAVPQVVKNGSDGLKSVEYGNIVPLLVEAMKEQQKEIESLKTEIEILKGNR